MYIYSKMLNCFLLMCVAVLVRESVPTSDENVKMLPAKSLFGACQSSGQCKKLRFTYCNNKGECVCLPNYDPENGNCNGKINAVCFDDSHCQDQNNVACIFYTCKNYTGFFASNPEIVKLYRTSRIKGRCQTNDHCSDLAYTECIGGKCICASGFQTHRIDQVDFCKPGKIVTCSYDADCEESGTVCLVNKCMDPAEFFDKSNAFNVSLFVTKRVGDYCGDNRHCRNLNFTECQDGTCNCIYGTISVTHQVVDQSTKTIECLQVLNSTCTLDDQCSLFGAKCLLNLCLYPDEFFMPSNAHYANMHAADNIGGACRTNNHCRKINGSQCVDQMCLCANGLKPNTHRECL